MGSLPTGLEWGYKTEPISAAELVDQFKRETMEALGAFNALPEGSEPCNDRHYCRVSVTIPLSKRLFDQLMNGPTGYRAHYSVDVELGELFNRQLVAAVADVIVESHPLYGDRFTPELCSNSVRGRFTKLWYAKQLTDPDGQRYLETLPEVLRVPRWRNYWNVRPRPHKGLLAPLPDDGSILLNGTFVNGTQEPYEQKAGRSKQLFDAGWT